MATLFTSVQLKFLTLRNEFHTKGFWTGLINFTVEFIRKRQYRKIGVMFPDYSENLALTKSHSLYQDAHENQETSFFLIQRAFRHIPILAKDICLLDIGCGSGKAMVVGMKSGFRRVAGVDLDSVSLEQARSNCRQMFKHGSKTRYNLSKLDASLYGIPKGTNLIYLFNPFGIKTMEQVIANIKAYAQSASHPVYIVYMNPRFQHLFQEEDGFLKMYASTFRNGKRPEMSIFLTGKTAGGHSSGL